MAMNSDSILPEEDLLETSEETEPEMQSESSAVSNVVKLLPVHAAPTTNGYTALKVDRGRGRPRKVERMPTTSDLEYHATMTEQKGKFVDGDPVVRATSKPTTPLDMLAIIKREVAKECAALHFQRLENEKLGRDTAQISTRRIDALKKIADIELEIKKLGSDVIDVHSEKFQRVAKFWVETIREIAEQTLQPEQIDMFFNRFMTAMEGWEEKVGDLTR